MSGLDSSAASRSRLRILTHTLTIWHEGAPGATPKGRVVPIGGEGGAYAPVAQPIPGLAGIRSSHLGLLEGTVTVLEGDEIHEDATIYYVKGVTLWEGLTACALEQVRG